MRLTACLIAFSLDSLIRNDKNKVDLVKVDFGLIPRICHWQTSSPVIPTAFKFVEQQSRKEDRHEAY